MNTEQQLAVRGECIVVNTVLDNPVAKLPPNICTALAYSSVWESIEAREIAKGIRKAIEKKRPTHRMVVKYYTTPEYRDWLFHPTFMDSWLDMTSAEEEAKLLVKRYANKRLINWIAVAYGEVLDRPEKVRGVAAELCQKLQGVL